MGTGSLATKLATAEVSSVVNPTRTGLTSVTRSISGSPMALAISRWNGQSRTGPGCALTPSGSCTSRSIQSDRRSLGDGNRARSASRRMVSIVAIGKRPQ